jgi:hypothetical protein
MTISRNISVMAQGASSSGILAGGYGGLGASVSPTTAGNVLFTADGSVWSSTQKIVRGTAVATTSGTAVDFTSIPSWVKRITIMLQGVSTSGTSGILIQLGTSSGIVSTGYVSTGIQINNASGTGGISSTAGFCLRSGAVSDINSGHVVITDLSSNLWVASGIGKVLTTAVFTTGGNVTLAATLDRVRLTTVNGTDTFDAGSVNILYE